MEAGVAGRAGKLVYDKFPRRSGVLEMGNHLGDS